MEVRRNHTTARLPWHPCRIAGERGTIPESPRKAGCPLHNRLFAPLVRPLAAVALVLLMATSIHSQAQSPPSAPAHPAAQAKPPAKPNPNDEMLARAAKLYYSTGNDGLAGFDCAVHPDWRLLFLSADPGNPVTVGDPRIVLLDSVKMALHARMKGNSTLEWVPPAAPDKTSADLLEGMHGAMEQVLQGFLQFWVPFVDGSSVPSSSDGLDITKTDKGYKLHAKTSDTEVTEEFDNRLLLAQFNVAMSKATVSFSPTYEPTDKGLLVNAFLAHVLPAGAPASQTQEIRVGIEYQTIGGTPIPARLKMSVVHSGTFNFVFDGCNVNRQ